MEEECAFRWKFKCESGLEGLTQAGPARIKTIINCSLAYGDGMHVELQNRLDLDSLLTIWCHKNCVCSYVSPQRLNRPLKRQGNETNNKLAVPKRQRRSDISSFRFLEQCLFCGLQCSIEPDLKNPARWRRAVLCRTADRGSGSETFKQSILDKCIEQNDEWAGQVRVHVEGAISDLHAADGRYHVDCMSKFMNKRSVKYAHACSSYTTQDELDNAFCELIAVVSEDLSRIWNSVELLQLYHSKVGQMLTKKTGSKSTC